MSRPPLPPPDRRRPRPPAADVAQLRVRRPADFLAVVPYLLGFHPAESLVVLLSRQGRVVLTARLDLPGPASARPALAQVRALSAEHRVDELVLVTYTEDEPLGRRLLEALLAEVPADVGLRDALLVSGGRWWSGTCSRSCCPPEGTPFDPSGHPLAAEAVYAGLSAQPSRTALAAQVRGPAAADLPRLELLVEQSRATVAPWDRPAAAARMADVVRQTLRSGEPPDEATCVLLAVLALDLTVRDVAWALMSRESGQDHLRLWTSVVARSPATVAPAPLGLLGMAAWINGNGALLNCCVARLEEVDPAYTLGHLLAEISERALPPGLWDQLVTGLRTEVGAVAGNLRLH